MALKFISMGPLTNFLGYDDTVTSGATTTSGLIIDMIRFTPKTISLSVSVNDWDLETQLGGEYTLVFVNPLSSGLTITGITSGSDGQYYVIVNIGSFAVTFDHQSASSLAANRFDMIAGSNVTVNARDNIQFIYDNNIQRWRQI